ncbi:MAG: acyl-CoA dehydrogenase family protein [Acidimicrobiales bacterium]
MPDAIAARTLWCQMFSSGAGSDVASLQTRAVLDGDEWTINGQKVWTTLAHQCDYGILIARTDPEQPKHRGISMFIVDMKDPAVEIRQINQIDGGVHFNEIFFTDLRIPRLARRHPQRRLATRHGDAHVRARCHRHRFDQRYQDPGTSGSPKKLAVGGDRRPADPPDAGQALQRRGGQEPRRHAHPGRTQGRQGARPGGSLGKLHGAIIARMTRSMIRGDRRARLAGLGRLDGDGPAEKYMKTIIGSFSANIAGGTGEIQKNIIGDRVLGLPASGT